MRQNIPEHIPNRILPDYTYNNLLQMNNNLSPQEVKLKKIEFLRKLAELKTKGYQLSKEYDFTSSLEEMEYEYELLKSFVSKRNGIKVYKNILLQASSVLEFLNEKYDPFDFHLSGWSEHISVESDNWEDVWEEIYEKYKNKGKKMAPEIKLLYLIVVSASAFHFSKAHTSKLLGLDSLLASNPGLLSKIINPNKKEESKFMTPQEINIQKQNEELKQQELNEKLNNQKQKEEYIRNLEAQLNSLNTSNSVPMNIPNINANKFNMASNKINNNDKKPSINITKSEKVDDILNKIHNIKSNINSNNNDDTQDDVTSNERLLSESTISETKKKGRKNKQSAISIR